MSSPAIPFSSSTRSPERLNSARRAGPWSWWHLAAGAAAVVLAIASTSDAWADIVAIVRKDEEANHVLLVPFLVAWLIWVRRGRFRYLKPRGNLYGCAIMLAGWISYSLGDTYWVQAFWHGGAVLVAMGALIAVVGIDAVREFFPAFIVAMFVMPIPGRMRQQIALPMQTITATITQHVLDLIGIQTERSGNLLSVNGISVAIGEACNGLRMISAQGLVLFGFIAGTPLRTWARVVLLLMAPVSAIMCNVVRLVATVWVYGNFPTATAERFHDISGWTMLIASFLIIMAALRLARWALLPVAPFRLALD